MMTPPIKISVFQTLRRIMSSVDNILAGIWLIFSRNRTFKISNMLTFSGKRCSLAISRSAIRYGLIPFLSKGKQNIWSICLLPKNIEHIDITYVGEPNKPFLKQCIRQYYMHHDLSHPAYPCIVQLLSIFEFRNMFA